MAALSSNIGTSGFLLPSQRLVDRLHREFLARFPPLTVGGLDYFLRRSPEMPKTTPKHLRRIARVFFFGRGDVTREDVIFYLDGDAPADSGVMKTVNSARDKLRREMFCAGWLIQFVKTTVDAHDARVNRNINANLQGPTTLHASTTANPQHSTTLVANIIARLQSSTTLYENLDTTDQALVFAIVMTEEVILDFLAPLETTLDIWAIAYGSDVWCDRACELFLLACYFIFENRTFTERRVLRVTETREWATDPQSGQPEVDKKAI